jgi:uncharacterized membrane protein
MSLEKLENWWDDARSSLWFLPTAFIIVALVLAFLMPELDGRIEADLAPYRDWMFFGSASAARTILSTVAGSLVTVIAVIFSITILTLQQASTQYTPRIIRNFTRDRFNQVMLGAYVATFVYSLLVLRTVRGDDSPGDIGDFIPVLSVSLSMFMAVICLILLVYFIHHIALLFSAPIIIESIRNEVLEEIENMYPVQFGDPLAENDSLATFRERFQDTVSHAIYATSAGYLRDLDVDTLSRTLPDGGWAIVHPRVGAYVTINQLLLEVGGVTDGLDDHIDRLRSSFIVDVNRTMHNDPMFGVRQLVDIALKGLSPSIHDPTTAEQTISALGDIVIRLSNRQFPSRVRDVETGNGGQKHAAIWFNRPTFADYVDEAFSQIRRVARDTFHVTQYLLETLERSVQFTDHARIPPLQEQLHEILWQVEESTMSPRDKEHLRDRVLRSLTIAQR